MEEAQFKVIEIIEPMRELPNGLWIVTLIVDCRGEVNKTEIRGQEWELECYKVGFTWWE